jgi:hypothetical protein
MYLAAYAQRLDATELTFFDDGAIHFFSPHAKDKSAIFLLAIGKPMKESSEAPAFGEGRGGIRYARRQSSGGSAR